MVLCGRIMHKTLLFLLALQKRQLGFWSSCIFIIYPKGACTQLFLIPYGFPEKPVARGDLRPGASTAVKRPGSQPIWAFCSVPGSKCLFFCQFHTFNFCRFVLYFEIRKCDTSSFVLLSCNCFGYLGSFVVPHEF